MRIIILNQTFHPDVAATAQLMWDLAQHLACGGHEVHAVTSRSVYGSQERFEQAYECVGRIHIHRVAQTAFGKRHLPGRLCDFGSYYLTAWAKLQELPAADVILALTSPPMVALLGMFQKQFRARIDQGKVRLVYHVMDLYPEAAVAMGVLGARSPVTWGLRQLTRRTLELADDIIALGEDMKELIVANYGLRRRADRIHVVHPWADGGALGPLPRQQNPLAAKLGLGETFNIVYSGNLGMAHDVETLIGAIERMKEDSGTRFLFIGGGKRFEQLKRKAEQSDWPTVRFLPYQEREALQQSLNLADVHLISQLPAFTGVVVPSKLFGIMAVGKPAVMVGPAEAEVSRLISRHEAGAVVPNGLVGELVATLRQLREDGAMRKRLGRNAREAFGRLYDRSVACARIEQVLVGK